VSLDQCCQCLWTNVVSVSGLLSVSLDCCQCLWTNVVSVSGLLPVSLDSLFLIVLSVFYNVYFQRVISIYLTLHFKRAKDMINFVYSVFLNIFWVRFNFRLIGQCWYKLIKFESNYLLLHGYYLMKWTLEKKHTQQWQTNKL
jgi:hypothetical protein